MFHVLGVRNHADCKSAIVGQSVVWWDACIVKGEVAGGRGTDPGVPEAMSAEATSAESMPANE